MSHSRSFILSALWAALLSGPSLAATINLTIDAGAPVSPIPPQAYGTNQELSVPQIPIYRQGGNRMTGYNWENNSSNGGADYCQSSGSTICNHEDWYDLQWFGLPQNGNQSPATVITHFVNDNNSLGAESIITLQMAGYVSTDGNCNCFVSITGAADSSGSHWKNVLFEKGAPFLDPPDTSDNEVYMDELMNYLLTHLGNSSTGGAKYYCLDNEAALWRSTHPMIHPTAATYAEVASKGISLASVITSMDSGAEILGPVAYGWSEFTNNQGAPDAGSYSSYNTSNGFGYLNYYLDQFRLASNSAGRRLLHYLDVHWYPEAQGAGVRITNNDTSEQVAIARMQAPRSLWDPTYAEVSWISGGSMPITLIQRLQAAVSQFYPGTKIAMTEYNYGTGQDISGGIAQADFLGIVGKYGILACRWDDGSNNLYTRAAYNLYLNYDGVGAKFGELSLPASTSSVTLSSAYAARSNSSPDKIWVVAINRDYSNNNDASVSIANLSGGQEISSIRSFRFDTVRTAPTSVAAPSFTATGFTDSLPFRSATLYEITLAQPYSTFTITPTGTSTSTPTITPTATPTATGTLPTYTPTKTPTDTQTFTPTYTITLTPTATPPGCPVMFNGCEGVNENGTWGGPNATQALSTTNVTQGNNSLMVNISGPPSNAYTNFLLYNGIMDLSGFSPAIWMGVGNLIMDVFVSPSLTAGTTFSRFYLAADSDTAGLTNQYITGSVPVTAGANSVTFQINFAPSFLNSLTVTDHLAVLHFVYNTSATVTGSFYVDNIRLDRSPCAWTPTPTVCTDSLGHTCTPTFTPTITDTPTYTPTPSSLNILFPNPVKDETDPGFYYEVMGPVDQVKVKIFTVAFRKIYEDDALSTDIGQHRYTFNHDKINSISNGFYYVVLSRRTGGEEAREIMKLLIRR